MENNERGISKNKKITAMPGKCEVGDLVGRNVATSCKA